MRAIGNIEKITAQTALWRRSVVGLCLLIALLAAVLVGISQPSTAHEASVAYVVVTDGNHMNGGDKPCDTGDSTSAEHCHMATGCSASMPAAPFLVLFTKVASDHWLKPPAVHYGQAIDPQLRPPQASLQS